MLRLPSSADSLLVRTNFADDEAWTRARSAALEENSDGFRAYVQVVDDPALDGATWHQLRRAAAGREHAAVLFVVDRPALDDEHPILVVDLSAEARRPFRCVAQELWSVDNNLNIPIWRGRSLPTKQTPPASSDELNEGLWQAWGAPRRH